MPTKRERGARLAATVLQPFRAGALPRITAAAAPFATALASLEARRGTLKPEYIAAMKAQLLDERRQAVRQATADIKRELASRAAALAEDQPTPVTPEEFQAAQYVATTLHNLDPDEAARFLGEVVEKAVNQPNLLALLLPHARSLAKRPAFDVATAGNEDRSEALDKTIARATEASVSEFGIARELIIGAAARLDYQLDAISDVIATHGRFSRDDGDLLATTADPATGQHGLLSDLDLPVDHEALTDALDEKREAMRAAAEAASVGIS